MDKIPSWSVFVVPNVTTQSKQEDVIETKTPTILEHVLMPAAIKSTFLNETLLHTKSPGLFIIAESVEIVNNLCLIRWFSLSMSRSVTTSTHKSINVYRRQTINNSNHRLSSSLLVSLWLVAVCLFHYFSTYSETNQYCYYCVANDPSLFHILLTLCLLNGCICCR